MLNLSFQPTTHPLRVLCLGAHSDDIEIGCAGTLSRLFRERECAVHWVVLSAAAERQAEARSSAEVILNGAVESTIVIQSFRESYFPVVQASLKDFFEELKGATAPDVVFTHYRNDVHQDHLTVAQLTWNTYRDHLVLEYEIPKYEGDLGHPNLYVPLSRAQGEKKIEHLHSHFPSQASRRWFRPETFRALMTIRGVECNAPEGYAEAFHVRKARLEL